MMSITTYTNDVYSTFVDYDTFVVYWNTFVVYWHTSTFVVYWNTFVVYWNTFVVSNIHSLVLKLQEDVSISKEINK
jgi:hypothetical protein